MRIVHASVGLIAVTMLAVTSTSARAEPPSGASETGSVPAAAATSESVRSWGQRPRSAEEYEAELVALEVKLKAETQGTTGAELAAADLMTVRSWAAEDTKVVHTSAYPVGVGMMIAGGAAVLVGVPLAYGNWLASSLPFGTRESRERQMAHATGWLVAAGIGLGTVFLAIPLVTWTKREMKANGHAKEATPRASVVLGNGALRFEGTF